MIVPEHLALACLLFLLSVPCLPLCAALCEPPGSFGDNCQHQCNCQDPCNSWTGVCPTNCTWGFEGPTCQKRNVALRKLASSSSSQSNSWAADKAVDGDKRQKVSYDTCFHSNENSDTSPWWAVDLNDVFPMSNIVIYYRNEGTYPTDTLQRFVNAAIQVANATGEETTCARVTEEIVEEARRNSGVFEFNCPTSGRKLILRHGGSCPLKCILEPCEVQVFECTAGFGGQECNESCSAGRYGKGCLSVCGNCREGTVCRSTDGQCLQGCQPGWKEDLCKTACGHGTYGQNCSGQCGHCSYGANCHHVTGSCPGGSCQPGYKEDTCSEKCSSGTYGQDCSGQCGHCSDGANCHHVTGSCLSGSCQPGYSGDRCDETCVRGTYGQDCSGQCGHCSDVSSCHHVIGSCLSGSCLPGYRGHTCDERCLNGTYGQYCSGQCSHCSDGANCHHVTGSCLSGSCQPGYEGHKCDTAVSAQRGNEGGESSAAVIGGVVTAVLVAVVVAVVFVVLILRRKGLEVSTCKDSVKKRLFGSTELNGGVPNPNYSSPETTA